MVNFLFITAILSVAFGVFCSMKIVAYLSGRGVKINFFLLRLFLPKYVGQYREMTIREEGKPGLWYYPFVVSMNLAWMLAVTGIIIRSGS